MCQGRCHSIFRDVVGSGNQGKWGVLLYLQRQIIDTRPLNYDYRYGLNHPKQKELQPDEFSSSSEPFMRNVTLDVFAVLLLNWSLSVHRETWLAMMYCLLFGVLGFTSCAWSLLDELRRYLLSPVCFTCFTSCPPTPIEYITKLI